MRVINNLLDEDERILWKREEVQDLVPDFEAIAEKKKKAKRISILLAGFSTVLALLSLFFAPSLSTSIFLFFTFIFCCNFMSAFWIAGIYDKSKKKTEIYEQLNDYHSDMVLRSYPKLDVITNKHLIRLEPDRWEEYPIIYGTKNISDIFEYRNEFCFFNLDKLTEICKNIKPSKDKFELGLYFDVDEEIRGDDAPHHWLNELTRQEYLELLDILSRVTPNAEVSYLFKKQKDKDIV
jgi:hypothetical protein